MTLHFIFRKFSWLYFLFWLLFSIIVTNVFLNFWDIATYLNFCILGFTFGPVTITTSCFEYKRPSSKFKGVNFPGESSELFHHKKNITNHVLFKYCSPYFVPNLYSGWILKGVFKGVFLYICLVKIKANIFILFFRINQTTNSDASDVTR